MNTVYEIFGQGKDLTVLQMGLRALIIFIIALIVLRIAGRRSFGMQMPIDNILVILLGAILSRAVVGASPFIPTVVAAAVIAVLHRLFALIAIYNKGFGWLIKGDIKVLYEHGKINEKNMKKALISYTDLIEGIRLNANIESLEQAKIVYLERNGKISVIKNN